MSFKNARRLFAWKVESVIENMMQPMKIPECRTFRFPGLSIEYFRINIMKNRIFPYPSRPEGHPTRDQTSERICEYHFLVPKQRQMARLTNYCMIQKQQICFYLIKSCSIHKKRESGVV